MEKEKIEGEVEKKIKEKILRYLSGGKANTYRIASALKIDTIEVTEALNELEKESKIEVSGGVVSLSKKWEVGKKRIGVAVKPEQTEKTKTEKPGDKERILSYLLRTGKSNTYKLVSTLKIGIMEVSAALDELEKEGKIEISGGVAMLAKPRKESEENIKEKVEALEEKQKVALAKLREIVEILEE